MYDFDEFTGGLFLGILLTTFFCLIMDLALGSPVTELPNECVLYNEVIYCEEVNNGTNK